VAGRPGVRVPGGRAAGRPDAWRFADCQNAAVYISGSDPVLAVHDLAVSGAWYRDVLGCELHEVDPGNWCFCRSGAVTVMLGRCPDVPPAGELGDHSYVAYLHVNDVDAFHRRAVRAGAEVLKAPHDEPWGKREMGLRSPDGHRFMLGQSLPTT
jgi:uncharacterized glyoxalase superfamily protein PhnB